MTDEEIMKEAKPSFYLKNILPILLQNRVVHFLGFGNRLAFDPIPAQLQVLLFNQRKTSPLRMLVLSGSSFVILKKI